MLCEVERQRGDKAKGTWNGKWANGEIFLEYRKSKWGRDEGERAAWMGLMRPSVWTERVRERSRRGPPVPSWNPAL